MLQGNDFEGRIYPKDEGMYRVLLFCLSFPVSLRRSTTLCMIFVTFSGASSTSAAKLGEYRRQLFMGPPVTREAAKKMEDRFFVSKRLRYPSLFTRPYWPGRGPSWWKPQRWLAAGATEGNPQTQSAQGSTVAATRTAGNWRRAYPGDPYQPYQAQQAEVPENSNFNWALLKLPAETKFPVPVFLARLPAWHLRTVPSSTSILKPRMLARDGAERQSIASSHQQLLS